MASLDFSEERIDAFPTRIFRRRYDGLDGFNAKVRDIILKREVSSGSLVRSNVGGWHSENDLLRWNEPEIQVLINLIHGALLDYVALEVGREPGTFDLVLGLEGWANVTRRGNYAKAHVHPMSNVAVVYYVDVGDHDADGPADISGAIEFLDPRGRPNMFASPGIDPRDSLLSRPQSSVMLVFPAWLYHTVHPYQGERPRISIAVNATIKEVRNKPEAKAEGGRPRAKIVEEV